MPRNYFKKVVNKGWFKEGEKKIVKGHIPWNKGLKGIHLSPSTEFKKGNIPFSKLNPEKMPKNEDHWNWVGDKVSYVALHYWVKRKLGTPKICNNCETIEAKKYEWANISGDYKRDLLDWIRLCTKCHRNYDKNLQKIYRLW